MPSQTHVTQVCLLLRKEKWKFTPFFFVRVCVWGGGGGGLNSLAFKVEGEILEAARAARKMRWFVFFLSLKYLSKIAILCEHNH